MQPPLVSMIVPVLHDTDALARLIPTLPAGPEIEIIVVNGGASDSRLDEIAGDRPDVHWRSSPPGRGRQMNVGALSAQGRWVLFLHADTRLPPQWLDELRRLDADPSLVGGSFRFALDSDAWQARLIERGVGWRVRWLNLAYGDQALFARRESFHALGGYREWPLMEDVDLIRRLRHIGRLYHSRLPAITSARRWERDGWWRRTANNLALQLLFLAGVSPARLASRYQRSALPTDREALVVMARAPSEPRGKTRLVRGLKGDRVALRRAILLDTLDIGARVRRADRFVAYEPAAAAEEFRSLIGRSTHLLPQRGETLGDRMRHVFADLFARGYSAVVIVGSDLPTLPSAFVEDAFNELREGRNAMVVGPAADGGYYLIGLCRLVPELFESVPWSTPQVLQVTLEAAHKARLVVAMLPEWYDVDEVDDLRRVLNEPVGAERTRSWVAAQADVIHPSKVPESERLA